MDGCVAIDIGSTGGKIHYGYRDADDLFVEEIYRFDTKITQENGRLVWDIDYIVDEIVTGIETVYEQGKSIGSIGIDTTALDFGLIKDGDLIQKPYFYLDSSLKSKEKEILDEISRKEIFEITGYHGVPNSIYYQYHSNPQLFEEADMLLMLPQLLSFELGAEPIGEETYSTTLMVSDARTRDWAPELLDILDLPRDILPDLKPPGTTIGSFDSSLSKRIDEDPDILLPPSHDTASAMAALPFDQDARGFLCTGSWFIPGIELEEPVISKDAFEAPSSNELSVDGAIRYLLNIPGFSLLEHCRKTWQAEGGAYEYDQLLAAVQESEPYGPLIDPADDLFFKAQTEGNVIERIDRYCQQTDQEPPEGKGEITRCLLESLAARSAVVLESLCSVSETHTERIHIAGGGVRNTVFCQMAASVTGLPVKAGPIEATAIGNLISQLIAQNEIESYEEGRRLIRESTDFDYYEPRNQAKWSKVVRRMKDLSRNTEYGL